MVKDAYPHPEDDTRIAELMEYSKKLDEEKAKVARELRALIYKAEKGH